MFCKIHLLLPVLNLVKRSSSLPSSVYLDSVFSTRSHLEADQEVLIWTDQQRRCHTWEVFFNFVLFKRISPLLGWIALVGRTLLLLPRRRWMPWRGSMFCWGTSCCVGVGLDWGRMGRWGGIVGRLLMSNRGIMR